MEHNHSQNYDINLGKAFKTGITINIIFIVIEALFGYLSNSMALIADAGHNLSDVLALVFMDGNYIITAKTYYEIYIWVSAINNTYCFT